MNVFLLLGILNFLSKGADSEFTALVVWSEIDAGGPGRQGWSEEDEEGQIFRDADIWWYESIILGCMNFYKNQTQTPEMMGTGAIDVHGLFLNSWSFNSMPLIMLR